MRLLQTIKSSKTMLVNKIQWLNASQMLHHLRPKRPKFYNFIQSVHANAKDGFDNMPTMPYRLQPHSS